MRTENDLIQKLMISKKIMDKHKMMPRNQNGGGDINEGNISIPEVEEYKAPAANYNIPQDFLMESKPIAQMPKTSSKDKILSSKLPDEIKRLMMEHPIQQPNNPLAGGGTTLSSDLVEKASRLMNTKANGEPINENIKPRQQQITTQQSISSNEIKSIVRETVQEVLKENGLLVESTKKSNDVFKFRVGQHIFEGKVTRIRKVSE